MLIAVLEKRRNNIRSISYTGLVLLLALLAVDTTPAHILSENYFDKNGNKIHQFLVSIDSGSMSPNLNIGDLVVVEDLSRSGIRTWDEAERMGYKSLNLPGDVIVYLPYGKEILNRTDEAKSILGLPYLGYKTSPIIRRALRYVNQGQPMWEGGPPAPFSGYITKGDHNDRIDQMMGAIIGPANASYVQQHQGQIIEVDPDNMYIDKKTGLIIYKIEDETLVGEGISYLTPVKKEWIIGIVRARIPNGSDWNELSLARQDIKVRRG